MKGPNEKGHMASAEGIVVDMVIGVVVFGLLFTVMQWRDGQQVAGGIMKGRKDILCSLSHGCSNLRTEVPSLPRKVEQLMERPSPNHRGS